MDDSNAQINCLTKFTRASKKVVAVVVVVVAVVVTHNDHQFIVMERSMRLFRTVVFNVVSQAPAHHSHINILV